MSLVSQPQQKNPAALTPKIRLALLAKIGLGLLLFGATLLAYGPALHGGLIMDDAYHVTAPSLQSWAGLRRIWTVVGATHQYFPLLHTAFWIEHRIWSDSVLGYHLTNVLLHAGSACLLVAIMRRLALPGAWFAGFIFALHPVCVESVAWISEQKNTLSTLLALGSALVYLRFDETAPAARFLRRFGTVYLFRALQEHNDHPPGGAAGRFVVETRTPAMEARRPAAPSLAAHRRAADPAGGWDGAEDVRRFAG